METRKYSKGTVIFNEGIIEALEEQYIYQVESGSVDIIVNYKLDKEQKLTTLQPKAYFGEIALLTHCPHSATAVAAEDCVVSLVGYKEYLEEVRKNPGKVESLIKNLGARIKSLTSEYMEVCKTLKEYGSKGSVGERSDSLWKRLVKFSSIYTKNGKTVSKEVPELERGLPIKWMGDAVYFDTKEIIFKEGEKSNCMYYIISGDVALYSSYGVKDQKLLTTLTNGSFFGELGLVGDDPRSATAVAVKNGATIDRIRLEDLKKLIAETPAKVDSIFNYLANRLVKLTNEYLKACATAANVVKASEDEVELTLSQEEALKVYMEMEILGNFSY